MATDTPDSLTDDVWSSRTDVPFETPTHPYRREKALRIVLPGATTPSAALETPVTKPLVQTLLETVDRTKVATVELLVFPNRGALEYLLCVTPATVEATGRDAEQQTLADYDESFQRPVATALGRTAGNRLPNSIGLEQVDLDLGPLGMSAVPTCRLVIPENRHLAPGVNLMYQPLVRTLQALHTAREPYVYQLIVGRQKGKYLLTVRLATYDPTHNFTDSRGFHTHVTEGHDYDLGVTFADVNASSNFQLSSDGRRLVGPVTDDRSTLTYNVDFHGGNTLTETGTNALRTLVAGKIEHERLLQGTADYGDRYTDQDVYPRFRVTAPKVGLFATLAPAYYAQDPWATAPYRGPPSITTQEIIRKADGTPQGSGSGPTTGITTDPAIQNKGSYTHLELEATSRRFIGEHGDTVVPVDQDTKSLPDDRLETTDGRIEMLDMNLDEAVPMPVDDDIVNLEYGNTNDSKPANTLTNAARAARNDRMVIFVFPTEQKARWAIRKLRKPFRETADHGLDPAAVPPGATGRAATRLYNWTEPVRLADGSQPLLPPGCTKAKWWLTPDGRLRLDADDRTLAEGDATESVCTYTYDCDHYRQVDGDHVVERPDGERRATFATKQRLTDERTLVRLPHVPVELSYLERSIVMYQDGTELAVVSPAPEWDVSGHMDRYEGAITEFLGTYTAHVDGAELPKQAFRERFRQWYARQTDRKQPANNVFGQATPVDDDEDMKSRGGNTLDLFRDRTWIFPPGIESPDLPGVASGDTDTDADDDAGAGAAMGT